MFSGCSFTDIVIIPAKVTNIGEKAFYGCSALSSITVKTSKLKTGLVGADAFNGVPNETVCRFPSSKLKAYTTLFRAAGVPYVATFKKL